jgi:hypothetical protein
MDNPSKCYGVMIAQVSGVEHTRIIINGEEKLLDRAWTTEWETEDGTRLERWHYFYDPVTGDLLACRTGWVSCYTDYILTGGSSCDVTDVDRALLARRQGDPYLSVSYPKILLPGTAGQFAAYATIRVEVLGEIDEKWWCPALEVIWSDETRAFRESDCDPWDGSQVGTLQQWSFRRAFGIGHHEIMFRLSKAGRIIAQKRIVLTVSGT